MFWSSLRGQTVRPFLSVEPLFRSTRLQLTKLFTSGEHLKSNKYSLLQRIYSMVEATITRVATFARECSKLSDCPRSTSRFRISAVTRCQQLRYTHGKANPRTSTKGWGMAHGGCN